MARFGLVVGGVILGWLVAVATNRPTGASGTGIVEPSLPVKYEFCVDRKCTVDARFDDFDSCKFYEKFMKANCDSVSKPGTITCRTGERSTAESHCTR